jgi:hypothetical protein
MEDGNLTTTVEKYFIASEYKTSLQLVVIISTSYKKLSSVLLSRLAPYVVEIIEDHHCEFRYEKATTVRTF